MGMENKDGFIWLDGQFVPWRDAKVHVLTHSLHYGLGVFEGVRAYNTVNGTCIFQLDAHTDRLFRSAKIMQMDIPFDKETLIEAQKEIIQKNQLKSCYLRPLCFYGSEGMGLRADNLKTHVMIAAWEWGAYLGEENLTRGIKVRTSSYTRHHVNVTLCKAKSTGNYSNSMLALREAVDSGCEEAMLLDAQGYVAEGSGENIFIIRDGVISTPMLTSCLDGITRRVIMELAADRGYTVKEALITRDEVYTADEAFFTGTAAEVTPIRMVDKREIGSGQRGPITEELQSLFFNIVKGKEERYLKWLTPVNP